VFARREQWMYAKVPLEVVNGLTYVGVYFTSQLSMHKMAEAVSMQYCSMFGINLNVYPLRPFSSFLTLRLLQYCYMDQKYGV